METRTVLLVDDDIRVLRALERILRFESYRTILAGSGLEALDLMDKEEVHVIVTDLTMPEMGGLELLKHVQNKYPNVIRLVLSGSTDGATIIDSIAKGNIYRYIPKPWNFDEFKAIIRQAIDLFNLHQEKRDLIDKLEEHNRLLENRVEQRTKQILAMEWKAEIGKYAAQIVHNLNSPLQAVYGGLELADSLIGKNNPDVNRVRKSIRIARSGVSDLNRLIAGILTHVRKDTVNRTEDIDINEIIKREFDFFKFNPAYNYEVEKKIDLSDKLPRIIGDPIQIKQIIDNLVKNALDAMEHSTIKRLIIQTRLEDKVIIIQVSDTGEGIADENLDRIYSSEFTTKPIGKGTGLGLASVKNMVDFYSGSIRVESKRGEGTTFTVGIPTGLKPGLRI